jgi:Ni,Fe-hydrogenase maturation factor
VVKTNRYAKQIKNTFQGDTVFSRDELKQVLSIGNPKMKESTFGWLIYNLIKDHTISRYSRGQFVVTASGSQRNKYKSFHSDELNDIIRYLKKKYPLLDYVIWETHAYNEFANHQMARNCIVVEVEAQFEEAVFDALKSNYDYMTLYKPTDKELTLYPDATTIVVCKLTSEAPIENHEAFIEKLLVDLYANKYIRYMVNRGDYDIIFEMAFEKYDVNSAAMLRYAKRRGKGEEIAAMIKKFNPCQI